MVLLIKETLEVGGAERASALNEWRRIDQNREEKRQQEYEEHKKTIARRARYMYEALRKYVSGEFGEPKPKDVKSLIFSAVEGNLTEVRTWLLKFGEIEGSVDVKSPLDGKTALSIACAKGNVELVKLLLKYDANVDKKDIFGRGPLHYACESGSIDVIEYLMEKLPKLDSRDNDGITPLMIACFEGYDDIVDELLNSGAKIDIRDRVEKWSPLHYAAHQNKNYCVELLLRAGANIRIKSRNGETPCDMALQNSNKQCAIMLQLAARGKGIRPMTTDSIF